MSRRSDVQIVLDASAQPGTGSCAEHHERFVRPHALAEIERRGLDVEAVRQRIRALTAELRKLPAEDLGWVSIEEDDQGLWLLAAAVLEGRDPLPDSPAAGEAPAAGARRPVKRNERPASPSVPRPAGRRNGASPGIK